MRTTKVSVAVQNCCCSGVNEPLIPTAFFSPVLGRKEYEANILKPSASILDVLLGNPSCVPSVNFLLELLPALQPRFYSAASAVEYSPRAVHFAFSVVEAEVAGRVRRGVATGYLEDLCRK